MEKNVIKLSAYKIINRIEFFYILNTNKKIKYHNFFKENLKFNNKDNKIISFSIYLKNYIPCNLKKEKKNLI